MLAYLLILFGFSLRFLPLGHNMAPIAAIALFSGAYLDRRIAPWVPLVIMVVTDIVLGLHDMVFFTWGAFILVGFMGMVLKKQKTPLSIFLMTVGGSLVFFAVSNFGVWLRWYPLTFEGFVNCYVMALPFLRNTMAGNLVFSAVLFGSYELARRTASEAKYKDFLFLPVK
jgi:hypothetical protein